MVIKTLSFLFGTFLAFLLAFGGKKETPAAAIQVDYGQFMYMGLFAPLTILANRETELMIEGDGVNVSPDKGNNYRASGTRLGKSGIIISGAGLVAQRHQLEVRPLPDPTPRLGGNPKNKGGTIRSGEFRAQGGVSAQATMFCGSCTTVSYTIKYKAKSEDNIKKVQNIGARYTPEAQALIDQAKPGDDYSFENIYAKCPGDINARLLPSIFYKIIQ
jgi:GldM C-terminal domain